MEPPKGFWASLWSFVCFLPYFIGLFLLGNIKGALLCPLICLMMTIGNAAFILGLWAAHCIWTYYCVVRAYSEACSVRMCTASAVDFVASGGHCWEYYRRSSLWISFTNICYFQSCRGRKRRQNFPLFYCNFLFLMLLKCLLFLLLLFIQYKNFIPHPQDGTWSTVLKTVDIVKDVGNLCFDSYFMIMDDLREEGRPNGKYYEIRLHYFLGAVIVAVLGIIVDMPVVSFVAICKGPYMLFKGWKRLLDDLIGREGPFLETICVPVAGLAILLWPLAVIGAVLASMIASVFLGAYAGVVTYQESFLLGLRYIIAALSLYDEYSNDVLGMPEGSCFPRPQYRKKAETSRTFAHTDSFSTQNRLRKTPSRTLSLKDNIVELKPLELFDGLFKDCNHEAKTLVSEGLITRDDIEEAKSGKWCRVITIGLPAYCLLQVLLRSAKANSLGLLLSDGTEITGTNRPQAKIFEWLISPLLIIKDQIKAESLSPSEEDYLRKLVLLNGDPDRIKSSTLTTPESDRKRAELDALARRLQGITKYMTRLPTYKRRFDDLVKTLFDELANPDQHGAPTINRSKSAFARIMSLKSFKEKRTNGPDQESENARDSNTSL